MEQVFASWSGGKDSCFACYRAVSSGLEVRRLLNMITEDGKRSWTHGLSSEVLQIQAQAIGIPLVQRRTTWANYETDFKDALLAFKSEGISGGVFGDIDLEEHRRWNERMCQQAGITPHLPLWDCTGSENHPASRRRPPRAHRSSRSRRSDCHPIPNRPSHARKSRS